MYDATGYPTPNISWVRVNGETLPPPYSHFAVRVFIYYANYKPCIFRNGMACASCLAAQ